MLKELLPLVPPDVLHIGLVLILSLFIGLDREEHKQQPGTVFSFGGIRTFPLVGLVSCALAMLSAPQLLPWAIGFAVVGGLMMLSYWHKLSGEAPAGLTTEMSALATYVVGGLVEYNHYWTATTIAVLCVLLLELKQGLETLARRFESAEIVTVTKFLVLSVVILPVVPDQELTPFHLNPFKIWLVVVAVSGISFASYGLQRIFKERGGVMLAAILGGAYSSTATTVALVRQSKGEHRPNLFGGGLLTASGVMYARILALLAFFDVPLVAVLAPAFGALTLLGVLWGWYISRQDEGTGAGIAKPGEDRNPLDLGAALLFALIFVVVLIATALVREYLGRTGLYSLAVLMGVTDITPFILGLAQHGAAATPLRLAASAIVVAAASNNVVKAIYAYSFADRDTGRRSLILLLGLAVLGLAPLAWL